MHPRTHPLTLPSSHAQRYSHHACAASPPTQAKKWARAKKKLKKTVGFNSKKVKARRKVEAKARKEAIAEVEAAKTAKAVEMVEIAKADADAASQSEAAKVSGSGSSRSGPKREQI